MNIDFKNPFSRIRAEQMGDSAWKYFVEPIKDFLGNKPLIFEGSRGTGKTMFFKCNSWGEKYGEAKANGHGLQQFLQRNQHIGFYYKADSRFVKSLENKNIESSTWIGIFNTYFNIVIAKEIIGFISELLSSNIISFTDIEGPFRNIALRLKTVTAKNLDEMQDSLEGVLINIEQFANNTTEPQPVGLNAGTIIEQLVKGLKKVPLLSSTTFHVFIDEFENLSYSQQVEINTLLKQSNSDLVFDYGVITKGIQTHLTTMGQEIRPKDDFSLYSIDRYGYYEKNEYNNLLREICKKRLIEELAKTGKTVDSRHLEIDFYLKSFGKNFEEKLFAKSLNLPKVRARLLEQIKLQGRMYNYSDSEIRDLYDELIDCGPIRMRMHLALLLRRNQSVVPARELLKEMKADSPTYREWVHNMESAIVYLLCRELGVEKKYHGFRVFSALSSGVIRSFLELAEYAFDYAFNNASNPFEFNNPREFSIDEQTKAVYFVSKLKINEIDSYEPCGFKLKSFTIALGKIFNAIQTNSNATLGEVEQNHFETKVNDLKKHNPEANDLLKYAIRYKILEEDDSTKTKSGEVVEITDYHLNHIYCPAFKISHLRKRKIPIPHIDLAKLFCGSHRDLEDAVRKLSGIPDDNTPNLFSQL